MLNQFQTIKRVLAMFLAVIFLFTGTLFSFPEQARAYNDVCNDNNQAQIAESVTVLTAQMIAAGGTIAAITAKVSVVAAGAAWAAGAAGAVLALPVAAAVVTGGLTYVAWETLHPNVFARANLAGSDLHGANLSGRNLSEICLAGANLHEANLHGTNLRGANLKGADLSNADLSGADFTGANTSQVKWDGANLIGVTGL